MEHTAKSLRWMIDYLKNELVRRETRPAILYPIGAGAETVESIRKHIQELEDALSKMD